VGSFDGGYGASYMARIVGQKKAREIWFLCRQYDARQALEMGLVNAVVPYEPAGGRDGAVVREMLANSPIALRCLKAALNATATARPDCRNWPATRRCCSTCRRRPGRPQRPTSRSASPTSASSRAC